MSKCTTAEHVEGHCSFFIKRHQRFCRKLLVSSSLFCYDHEPSNLAQIREETFRKNAGEILDPPLKKTSRISSSQRRMANPFSFQTALGAPRWEDIFEEKKRVILDVGCARGKLLLALAHKFSASYNYIGVEIRPVLVNAANEAAILGGLAGLHFLSCNINVSMCSLFGNRQLDIALVCFQFPDPWKRKKHQKRRVLNELLVDQLAACLQAGALIYCSSDVEELALQMRTVLQSNQCFDLYDPDVSCAPLSTILFPSRPLDSEVFAYSEDSDLEPLENARDNNCDTLAKEDSEVRSMMASLQLSPSMPLSTAPPAPIGSLKWLTSSPLPLPSEREHVCEILGRPVFRVMFVRNNFCI